MNSSKIFVTECPRDAMQSWKNPIATQDKIQYLNQLLKVGFDVLDFGSFVSPKAIPQMADTAEVLDSLNWEQSNTKLLAIIANLRGATDASQHEGIKYLGFPFSISETFQLKNTNKTIAQSKISVQEILNIADKNNKKVLIYLSMGFGNPYGDAYSPDLLHEYLEELSEWGIKDFALADTTGSADERLITQVFESVLPQFPDLKIGAHFHAPQADALSNIDAAYRAGCRHFDTAILGIGGCPMSGSDLVGNIPTEVLLAYADQHEINLGWDENEWMESLIVAQSIFNK